MRDHFEDLEYEIDEGPAFRERPHAGAFERIGAKRVPIAIGVLALIVVTATLASRNGGHRSTAPRTTNASTPAAAASKASAGTPPATLSSTVPATDAPITTTTLSSITQLGGPLLPTKTGTILVGRTFEGLAVIDLDNGVVKRIAVRSPSIQGALAAGPDWILGGADGADLYLVRGLDDPVVSKLPATLLAGGAINTFFVGPDEESVWAFSFAADPIARPSLELVDLTTGAARRHITIDDLSPRAAMSGGQVLLDGIGGIYLTGNDGLRRVSSGALLAAGSDTIVTTECDEHHDCARVVTNVASGDRRTIPSSRGFSGTVSPDARRAAGVNYDGPQPKLVVVDLATGEQSVIEEIIPNPGPTSEAPVWSADGRYLFVLNDEAKLLTYDVTTSKLVPLDPRLPQILQLVARPPAPPS